ncbi:interleukin-21 receptor [Oryzias melastigma]|uniref:Interleukin 21 receptor n=1 Tax=Oryzias melastigma TaxID=30732 RepID=A0A3B3CRH7_ORYME|nr:interleukin-21 receptor [Oryzias melastigma]
MALRPFFLLVLWTVSLPANLASLCEVSCSTDYVRTLNCSCSGWVPDHPVILTVNCRAEDAEVNGSCVINSSQSWCTITKSLDDVASVETNCTTSVRRDKLIGNVTESASFYLCDVVKPKPPFDVKVTKVDDFYNISWSTGAFLDQPLTYRLRIRTDADPTVPVYELQLEEEKFSLVVNKLQPNVGYIVDVQAKFRPGEIFNGPWSEWSSGTKWRTPGNAEERKTQTKDIFWLYLSIPAVLILCLLILGYLQKPCWHKKLKRISFVPSPDEFFKPLHQKHKGNFKEWVKPVFQEHDYFKTSTGGLKASTKTYEILKWNNEKHGSREESELKDFLRSAQPSNPLLFFPESGSSQGTGHSTGHISIHTVTLSGEEYEDEVTSRSSLTSYQDGESFGSFDSPNIDRAGYNSQESLLSMMDRHNERSPQHENQIIIELRQENFEPEEEFLEPERVSLNSFASGGQSEDGYPQVDLDTIDSGFGECSSPGGTDSTQTQHMDPFLEHSNSNYVKQWMICSTIQEESTMCEQ